MEIFPRPVRIAPARFRRPMAATEAPRHLRSDVSHVFVFVKGSSRARPPQQEASLLSIAISRETRQVFLFKPKTYLFTGFRFEGAN